MLFISHYSGRNGAPLFLLRLMKWIKTHTNLEINVLLRSSGELQSEFEAVGSVFLAPRLAGIVSGILRRTCGEAMVKKMEGEILRRRVRGLNPSLIYSNTITNTREIAALAALKIPILCHVHEMEYWIRHELGLEKAIAAVPLIDRFIAAGGWVKDYLINGLGVGADIIEVIHPFPCLSTERPAAASEMRGDARRELGMDNNTFVIGGCGTVDWRKGADLFLSVARRVSQMAAGGSAQFVWVGGPTSGKFYEQLQYDVTRSGLGNVVSFVGPCSSAEKYYAMMDVFMLPSREDPYPLVMLEAASYGLPILCFEGSGGAGEFVGDDAGICVPYLDTNAMAEAVLRLRDAPEVRARLGAAGKERVRERHDPDTQCAAIFGAMARTQPLLACEMR